MKNWYLSIVLLLSCMTAQTQPEAYRNDIRRFQHQDSLQAPPSNAVLLIGSSSFTKWTDVQSYFPQFTIINRGFGGSTLSDLIYYAKEIVYPYHPKQILIYCGENDFAASADVTPVIVKERLQQLIQQIRTWYPRVPIAYISMKPSPSRTKLLPAFREANLLIRKMLKKMKRTRFIDVYPGMLNADGSIKQEIFIADQLHMNAKGYAIWQKIIEPFLIK